MKGYKISIMVVGNHRADAVTGFFKTKKLATEYMKYLGKSCEPKLISCNRSVIKNYITKKFW